MPLSGVLLASIVLGESLTIYTLVGALFIIYGIYRAENNGNIKKKIPVQ